MPIAAMNFNKLFRECSSPVFVVGPRRKLLYVSKEAAELLGVPPEKLKGLTCRWHGATESSEPANLVGSLCPPPEAFAGQPQRTHVLLLNATGGRSWRCIQFLPLPAATAGTCTVLGWIGEPEPAPPEMPEPLRQALARHRMALLEQYGLDRLVAASPAMQRVLRQVRLAAGSTATVFLVGEAGVGKETLARAIHYLGPNRDLPLVPLDCEHLPHEVLQERLGECELLGRPSLPRGSRIGAVYLEEPSYLPMELQLRLLDGLQRGESKTRLLAGARDRGAVEGRDGRLHPPLAFALSTLTIFVPPLRERAEDLPLLVQQKVEVLNATETRQVLGLSPAAWEAIRAYPWPGNLDQLHTVVEEACTRARGETVERTDLPWDLRVAVETAGMPALPSPKPLPLDHLLASVERRLLVLALKQARGNKSKAAARLGISRARIHRRLLELGLVAETEAGETDARSGETDTLEASS